MTPGIPRNRLHAAAVVLAAVGAVALANLRVGGDLQAFIPATWADDTAPALLGALMHRGTRGTLVVARFGPADLDVLQDAGKRLKAEWTALDGVDVIAPDEAGAAGPPAPYRYLLVDDAIPGVPVLARLLQQRLDVLRFVPDPALARRLVTDPTGALARYLDAASPVRARPSGPIWVRNGRPYGYLLLHVGSGTMDAAASARRLEAARRAARPVLETTGLKLDLAGPPALAAEARQLIRGRAQWVGLAGLAATAVLLWLAYRHRTAVVFAAMPIAAAFVAGAWAVAWIHGTIHGIALAFGATLIGVVADYPVHAMSHARSGASVAPTLLLGALTTAAAYGIGFTATGVAGLDQLGTFAMTGVAAGIGMTLWMWRSLPAMNPRVLHVPMMSRRRARAILVLLAGGLAAIWSGADWRWSPGLTALNPLPAALIDHHRRVQNALGLENPRYVVALTGPAVQDVLSAAHELARRKRAEGCAVHGAADVVPPVAVQRRRQQALPERAALRERMRLAARRAKGVLNLDSFEPFYTAVETARSLAPLTPEDLEGTAAGAVLDNVLFPLDGNWVALVYTAGVRCLGLPPAPAERVRAVALDLDAGVIRLGTTLREIALERLLVGVALIAGICVLTVRPWPRMVVIVSALGFAGFGALGVQLLAGAPLSIMHILGLLVVAGLVLDYALILTRCTTDGRAWHRACHGTMVGAATTVTTFLLLAATGLPVLVALGSTVALGVAWGALAAWVSTQAWGPGRRAVS